MKMLMCGLTLSLGFMASSVQAEINVTVEGTEYPLSTLMANCVGMVGAPEAQIACFNAVSNLLKEQRGGVQSGGASVSEALDGLRAVAQYQDEETGLSIVGTGCNIQVIYFNNYYHLSRRNVSTIDLFSAEFDASKLQYDQTTKVGGAQAPLSKGLMEDGVIATMHGGVAMESTAHNFAAKSARATLEAYANEVASQLPAREDQSFDFVLVHPKQSEASGDIWSAFETFVKACKV